MASNIEYFSIDDKLYKCYRYFFWLSFAQIAKIKAIKIV
jgi:hypothetical protein